MNKCQIAELYDVSRPTVNDWIRRGCPVNSDGSIDPGEVAAWKLRRDFRRLGIEEGDPDVPVGQLADLQADLVRRRIDLNSRIDMANALPSDARAEPGIVKVAIICALMIEAAILRFLDEVPIPATPWQLQRSLLAAMDAARGEPTNHHTMRDTRGDLK